MPLPKSIKIGGHRYAVKLLDMVNEEGNANLGEQHTASCSIRINNRMAESQQWTTLLHEILEALKYDLAIDIEHDDLSRLEAGLFQVLTDNFRGWRG